MTRCSFASHAVAIALALCQGTGVAADPLPEVDWAKARVVNVQMIDDRFVPDRFVFQRGTAYRLHMENAGADLHEFTAPEFLKAIAIRNPEVLERTRPDEIALQPQEQKDLYFVARTPGRYKLTCANHEWDNMVGEITIE